MLCYIIMASLLYIIFLFSSVFFFCCSGAEVEAHHERVEPANYQHLFVLCLYDCIMSLQIIVFTLCLQIIVYIMRLYIYTHILIDFSLCLQIIVFTLCYYLYYVFVVVLLAFTLYHYLIVLCFSAVQGQKLRPTTSESSLQTVVIFQDACFNSCLGLSFQGNVYFPG